MAAESRAIPRGRSPSPIRGQQRGAIGLGPIPESSTDLIREGAVLSPRRRRPGCLFQDELQLGLQRSAAAAGAGFELLDDGLIKVADQNLGHHNTPSRESATC
jgi:hypothetical protein